MHETVSINLTLFFQTARDRHQCHNITTPSYHLSVATSCALSNGRHVPTAIDVVEQNLEPLQTLRRLIPQFDSLAHRVGHVVSCLRANGAYLRGTNVIKFIVTCAANIRNWLCLGTQSMMLFVHVFVMEGCT